MQCCCLFFSLGVVVEMKNSPVVSQLLLHFYTFTAQLTFHDIMKQTTLLYKNILSVHIIHFTKIIN